MSKIVYACTSSVVGGGENVGPYEKGNKPASGIDSEKIVRVQASWWKLTIVLFNPRLGYFGKGTRRKEATRRRRLKHS